MTWPRASVPIQLLYTSTFPEDCTYEGKRHQAGDPVVYALDCKVFSPDLASAKVTARVHMRALLAQAGVPWEPEKAE